MTKKSQNQNAYPLVLTNEERQAFAKAVAVARHQDVAQELPPITAGEAATLDHLLSRLGIAIEVKQEGGAAYLEFKQA